MIHLQKKVYCFGDFVTTFLSNQSNLSHPLKPNSLEPNSLEPNSSEPNSSEPNLNNQPLQVLKGFEEKEILKIACKYDHCLILLSLFY